jgi:hypothetical protein
MTVQSTFKHYLRLGKESTWGTAPSGSNEFNANGNWFSAITTSPLGSLVARAPKYRSKGSVAKRSQDQHPTVPLGQHSEGTLEIPFVPTYGGLFLAAALGAESVADTADAAILAATALSASPQTIDAGFTQPTATKYPYFKFTIDFTGAATFGATGKIVVVGTDFADAVITETITFGAQSLDFIVYSQLSYKTITSVVLTGFSAGGGSGTVAIDGIVKTTHTITCADTSGSFALEQFGDPSAGSGNSFIYTGLVQTGLQLAFSALEEEGLLVMTPTWQGKFPTTQTATAYAMPLLRPWPSWGASVTKGWVAYARLQAAQLQITPGARLYRSAVNSQSPQGQIPLSRVISLSGQLYVEDNTEYDAWQNSSVGDYELTFTSPFKVTSTEYQSLKFEFTQMYFETIQTAEDDGMVVANFEAYTLEDASDNVLKATLINTKNGAY